MASKWGMSIAFGFGRRRGWVVVIWAGRIGKCIFWGGGLEAAMPLAWKGPYPLLASDALL